VDPLSSTWLASDLQQAPTWSKLYLLATDTCHWFLHCWDTIDATLGHILQGPN